MKSIVRHTLYMCVLFFTPKFAGAQVVIDADSRVEDQIVKKASKQMPGYRLQICFDSDKDLIDHTRKTFVEEFQKLTPMCVLRRQISI